MNATTRPTPAASAAISTPAARMPAATGSLTCEDCGGPIPARRREAHRGATRCVPCQEAQEKARG